MALRRFMAKLCQSEPATVRRTPARTAQTVSLPDMRVNRIKAVPATLVTRGP